MSYVFEINRALTRAGVPTHDDHGRYIDNEVLRVNVLADDRDRCRDQRDAWIRLFNRLDAAISHHRKANGVGFFVDDADEALYAARDRILSAAAEFEQMPSPAQEIVDALLVAESDMSEACGDYAQIARWIADRFGATIPEEWRHDREQAQ